MFGFLYFNNPKANLKQSRNKPRIKLRQEETVKPGILIITPDEEWARVACTTSSGLFTCDYVLTGKEGQLKLYHNEYTYVFVHLGTQNNSGLEVLRYLQNGFPEVKTFVLTGERRLEDFGTDEAMLKRLKVYKVLPSLRPEEILSAIKSVASIKKWHAEDSSPVTHGPDEESEIGDTKFTRIKIDELFEDAKAIFDYYLRLGTNRYIKIIHKGEISSSQQIKKYADSGAKYIYFLAEDRADFIGYQNELTSEMLKKNTVNEAKIMKSLKTTTDKYIEEVFVQGIQPQLIEEGKHICDNMFEFAKKDKSLRKVLSSLEEFNPAVYSHSFLVSFFSTVISKNLDWVGAKTLEALSLGALFHDIGLVQIPENIVTKKMDDMNDDEQLIFKQHPKRGTETLQGIPSITTSIQNIVLQHHEMSNGSGFPLGLTGHKIFPLAKIIGLADGFSDYIMEKECSPLDGIKDFLNERDNLARYDSELVKSLVKGFVSPK